MSRRSIGRYLALSALRIVATILSQNEVKPRRQNTPCHATEETEDTDDLLSSRQNPPLKISADDRESSKNSHDAQEEDYWFWTKWAALVAATGAVVAAIFAAGVIDRIKFGRHVNIFCGRSPNVIEHDIDIYRYFSFFHLGANFVATQDYCDQTKMSDFEQRPGIVFPKVPNGIPASKISYDRRKNGLRGKIWLEIVGCVVYTGPGDTTTRKTGFAYALDVLDLNRIGPLPNLKIRPNFFAGGYAD